MSERTIAALLKHGKSVFVYIKGENLGKIFLKMAASEGFTYGDGVAPQKRQADDVMAIHDDLTINFVGWIGHMAFYYPLSHPSCNSSRVSVDFGKYISGDPDYIITDRSQL